MPLEELKSRADALEEQIAATSDAERPPLRAQLHQVIAEMAKLGAPIPRHYRELEHDLVEEEIEEQFDNMPL